MIQGTTFASPAMIHRDNAEVAAHQLAEIARATWAAIAAKNRSAALRGLLRYASVRAVLFAEQRAGGLQVGYGDELRMLTAAYEQL